jgi:hypothetical protein
VSCMESCGGYLWTHLSKGPNFKAVFWKLGFLFRRHLAYPDETRERGTGPPCGNIKLSALDFERFTFSSPKIYCHNLVKLYYYLQTLMDRQEPDISTPPNGHLSWGSSSSLVSWDLHAFVMILWIIIHAVMRPHKATQVLVLLSGGLK